MAWVGACIVRPYQPPYYPPQQAIQLVSSSTSNASSISEPEQYLSPAEVLELFEQAWFVTVPTASQNLNPTEILDLFETAWLHGWQEVKVVFPSTPASDPPRRQQPMPQQQRSRPQPIAPRRYTHYIPVHPISTSPISIPLGITPPQNLIPVPRPRQDTPTTRAHDAARLVSMWAAKRARQRARRWKPSLHTVAEEHTVHHGVMRRRTHPRERMTQVRSHEELSRLHRVKAPAWHHSPPHSAAPQPAPSPPQPVPSPPQPLPRTPTPTVELLKLAEASTSPPSACNPLAPGTPSPPPPTLIALELSTADKKSSGGLEAFSPSFAHALPITDILSRTVFRLCDLYYVLFKVTIPSASAPAKPQEIFIVRTLLSAICDEAEHAVRAVLLKTAAEVSSLAEEHEVEEVELSAAGAGHLVLVGGQPTVFPLGGEELPSPEQWCVKLAPEAECELRVVKLLEQCRLLDSTA